MVRVSGMLELLRKTRFLRSESDVRLLDPDVARRGRRNYGPVRMDGAYDEFLKPPPIAGFLQIERGFISWKLTTEGVSMNIGLHNRGKQPIENAYFHNTLRLVQIGSNGSDADRSVLQQFQQEVADARIMFIRNHISGNYVGVNDSIWDTLTMPLSCRIRDLSK